MEQFSVRLSDERGQAVRRLAAARGTSINQTFEDLVAAATDPALADDERQALRKRLAWAGLVFRSLRPAGRGSAGRGGARARPGRCGRGHAAGQTRPRGAALSALWDSSALVKLYADEEGAEEARQWRGGVVMSALSMTEVLAAHLGKDAAR